MKKYQSILSVAGGIALLALLGFGTTTALLTDKDQKLHKFRIPGNPCCSRGVTMKQ